MTPIAVVAKKNRHRLNDPIRFCIIMTLLCLFISCQAQKEKTDHQLKRYPVGVEFDDLIVRLGENGDNWCMTWAADGDIYTSMCDGKGWLDAEGQKRPFQVNQIYRISGGPDTLSFKASPLEGAPDYSRRASLNLYGDANEQKDQWTEFPRNPEEQKTWAWYAYGIVSIAGDLFQFISHPQEGTAFGWFDGAQLIYKRQGGELWKRWNGTSAHDEDRWFVGRGGNRLLFYNEPDYAFSFITVAQYGQDYRENKDGYVYLYSPNGKEKSHRLNLARVKKEFIPDRTKWEYFVRLNDSGDPEWAVNDITKRGDVHSFPEGWGWYSWSPSVVWNKDLGLFIMACAGTQRPGTGPVLEDHMHYETGGLMLLWAENPWGPWNTFHWDEVWDADHTENRLYLPQLSPKWIFDNGTTMYLTYSDARDGHSTNYKWNMQKIQLVLEGR